MVLGGWGLYTQRAPQTPASNLWIVPRKEFYRLPHLLSGEHQRDNCVSNILQAQSILRLAFLRDHPYVIVNSLFLDIPQFCNRVELGIKQNFKHSLRNGSTSKKTPESLKSINKFIHQPPPPCLNFDQ